ncbi:PP2C family protein-serine/threonine phosphatase [Kitasatospora sp. NPDC059571]|uniref:PP2C family protein-serine/threonine phosphatase n=1 Tax=Kitasatospora sp. NPDC059571 TaxID=3346871 RepID=UPI0036A0FFFE
MPDPAPEPGAAASDRLRRTVARLRREHRSRHDVLAATAATALPMEPPQGLRPVEPGLRELLDAVPVPAVLTAPVTGADGTLQDLAALAVNLAAVSYAEQAGPSVREQAVHSPVPLQQFFPALRERRVLTALTDVLRTGRPMDARTVDWLRPRPGGRIEHRRALLSAHPCGDRILLLLEREGEQVLAVDAQRIARVGWAEWNLLDGRMEASPGLFDLLGLPATGPAPPLTALLGRVVPAVLPDLLRDFDRLLSDGGVDTETALTGPTGVRRIRLAAETVRAAGGRPGDPARPPDGPVVGVRAVLQDITDLVESRRRLRYQESETLRERQRADAEEEIVRRLRAALVPRAAASLTGCGLETAVAYRPAEAGVGGDWYKCRALPDGPALLAIGDARGHGLDAVALMSRLRHALGGLAFTGALVEDLGAWLNEIAYDDGPESTATAVIARYYPDRRLLRWICAGHPPPVLYRDGRARPLTAAVGPPFGVLSDTRYTAVETVLAPGDTVLLYTDGLVERRHEDIDVRIAVLADAAASRAGADLQACIDAVVRDMSGPRSEDDATVLAFRVAGPR